MTEERMICERKSYIPASYEPFNIVEAEWTSWAPVEPAPPKDWRPFCFNEFGYNDICEGRHQVNWMGYVQKELEDECINCPYRKHTEPEKVEFIGHLSIEKIEEKMKDCEDIEKRFTI
jgi:hypothetical protein